MVNNYTSYMYDVIEGIH